MLQMSDFYQMIYQQLIILIRNLRKSCHAKEPVSQCLWRYFTVAGDYANCLVVSKT